jgi:hypothetical protein
MAKDFAEKWKHMVRKAHHLEHYNSLDDDNLTTVNINIYPLLSKTLDRGLDSSLIGNFFVNLGKDRMKSGFPVSEVIYTVNLTQKVLIEYIMTEFAPESPIKMYQSMTVISQMAEFFLLACFYITKGYLEEVYTSMNAHDSINEEFLKQYFRDDFFFKKESPD